jgi:hypothetical protein
MMGATSELNKDNITSATIEELSEEEHQDYLVAEEHFKAQFFKGFKKDRAGQVKRVQDFVMPSFTLENEHVKVINNVSTSPPTCSVNYHPRRTRKLLIHISPQAL